jgi:hypothetical protein
VSPREVRPHFISAGKTYKPAHKRTPPSYLNKILWNGWHGSFYWVDDLAFEVCRKLYDEFDTADNGRHQGVNLGSVAQGEVEAV